MKYSLVMTLLFSASVAFAQTGGGTGGGMGTSGGAGAPATNGSVSSPTGTPGQYQNTTTGGSRNTTSQILNRRSTTSGTAIENTSATGTTINKVSPAKPAVTTTARCTTASGQSLSTTDLGYTDCTNTIRK